MDNPISFVQKAIETGKLKKFCMSYRCTTCGAIKFRNRIYGPLKRALNLNEDQANHNYNNDDSPLREGNSDRHEVRIQAPWNVFSPIDNKVVFERLLADMKDAKLNTHDYDVFHAMRLVIMELHDNNAETILGNDLEYFLAGSDFGIVLKAMRYHYAEGKERNHAHLERQRVAQEQRIERKKLRQFY